jgi:adenylate kinase family enzyme
MYRWHVHILGASGSGTSTLGRALAEQLSVPFHDTDAFYWLPTDPPFRQKRDVPERCRMLRAALSQSDSWVLSGSLCSWGQEFVPDFTTVVFVELDPAVRMARLRRREILRYGVERLQSSGDLAAQHAAFMRWAASYEEANADGRSRAVHEQWLAALPATCQVVRINSERTVDELVNAVSDSLQPSGHR